MRGANVAYDVLVVGGRVIDPANGVSARRDVALKDGKVAAVGEGLETAKAGEVIDASGCCVAPGLIDFHTHVYKDVSIFGIEADDVFPRSGVTTAVDAGTAGWINYRGLERYVIARSEARILAFVNLSGVGLPWRRGEMVFGGYVQPEACAQAVGEHPATALGVKVRLYKGAGGDVGLRDLLQLALDAARRCGKPLMVHISGCDVPLAELLPPLRPGDIVTHCYHAGDEASLLNGAGAVLPEVREARERGVLFDLGHGLGSFSFDVCRKALEGGFPPDTISTDLHGLNINGPVYDLPTTMTKFLNLGMPLEEVVRRVTTEPAKMMGKGDSLGHLGVGAVGDVAVLAQEHGSFDLTDSEGQTLTGSRRLVCKATVRAGQVWWKQGT